ncbi:hypothetical protein [Methylobacter sp.]|uniref:hypothetical protein n=1 Tax=Methylobacter sp. TaxID=2051955 RepID=UPI002487D285|nr:hypothetical protein [Methylobacter sp.]MDI1278079.1 hypothetical protein [Methylobacter sp.]
MRFAVIDNGIVSNIIEADGDIDGLVLIKDDGTAKIGGRWDGIAFFDPVPPALTVMDYEKAVQVYLDNTAAMRGYGDDRTAASVAIATYDNDPNPIFS